MRCFNFCCPGSEANSITKENNVGSTNSTTTSTILPSENGNTVAMPKGQRQRGNRQSGTKVREGGASKGTVQHNSKPAEPIYNGTSA